MNPVVYANPLRQLEALGQSVWLDDIRRGWLRDGTLARLIAEDGVTGVTSNPAIFGKAISDTHDYDAAITDLARRGLDARAMYEALVIEDIQSAADLLLKVYETSDRHDGYVSLEVSPHLAHDTEATIAEAQRLWAAVDRANLMIKVPGTRAGLPAIRRLIAAGINVNVTLLFSVERYREAARAYQSYTQLLADARWQALTQCGARSQRLLWASTGTKDPAYSDTKYVAPLCGRGVSALTMGDLTEGESR